MEGLRVAGFERRIAGIEPARLEAPVPVRDCVASAFPTGNSLQSRRRGQARPRWDGFGSNIWREPVRSLSTLLAASAIAAATTMTATAADISGAGATFPYPIYAKWADA
jgi:hypothetical protein